MRRFASKLPVAAGILVLIAVSAGAAVAGKPPATAPTVEITGIDHTCLFDDGNFEGIEVHAAGNVDGAANRALVISVEELRLVEEAVFHPFDDWHRVAALGRAFDGVAEATLTAGAGNAWDGWDPALTDGTPAVDSWYRIHVFLDAWDKGCKSPDCHGSVEAIRYMQCSTGTVFIPSETCSWTDGNAVYPGEC